MVYGWRSVEMRACQLRLGFLGFRITVEKPAARNPTCAACGRLAS